MGCAACLCAQWSRAQSSGSVHGNAILATHCQPLRVWWHTFSNRAEGEWKSIIPFETKGGGEAFGIGKHAVHVMWTCACVGLKLFVVGSVCERMIAPES